MKFTKIFVNERKNLLGSFDITKRKYNLLLYSLFLYVLYQLYWKYTLIVESWNIKTKYALVLYAQIPIIIIVTLLNIFYQTLYRCKFESFEK